LFTISVQTSFWASHQLKLPSGQREKIHSHNWLVQALVSADQLNKMGLVFDFNRLKSILTSITDTLTDSRPEDNPYFQQNNSSAEMLAQYIYESLEKKLPDGVSLDSVTVTEEPDCSACFKKTTM
jgi:6-pyruvoyltetrahydropterin/6-carboxytetrahydropterin synthase